MSTCAGTRSKPGNPRSAIIASMFLSTLITSLHQMWAAKKSRERKLPDRFPREQNQGTSSTVHAGRLGVDAPYLLLPLNYEFTAGANGANSRTNTIIP
jgi:hypothetical protein